MASKKRAAQPKSQKKQHRAERCEECSVGRWLTNHENLDVNGKPFLIECEHAQWCVRENKVNLSIRGREACENYKQGELQWNKD